MLDIVIGASGNQNFYLKAPRIGERSMTREIYDFLNDSLLLDEQAMQHEYAGETDERLIRELELYRQHVLATLSGITASITKTSRGPKAYVASATGGEVDREKLKRMALYFDQAVIDDPLFKITDRVPANQAGIAAFFGYKEGGGIDRPKLIEVTQQLRWFRPLVAHEFLGIAPVSFTRERPEQIPYVFSPTLFAERVPDGVREWLVKRARVHPLEPVEVGWRIVEGRPLTPCRAIAVEFGDFEPPMVFHLTSQRVEVDPKNENRFTFTATIPADPPEDDLFWIWVAQSINQCAGNIYERTAGDVALAVATDAMLLTDSSLISDLLCLGQVDEAVEQAVANLVLELSLPSVERATELDLMRVRTDHGESFERFRLDLERGLRSVSAETDAVQRRRRLDELRHELDELRVREMRLALRNLRQGLLKDAGIGVVSLAAAIPTGGLTLLGALVALFQGVGHLTDYRHRQESNPGHFLWKLQHRSSGAVDLLGWRE